MTGHSSDSIVEYSVFEERWTLEALTTMSQVNEVLFSFGETADDIQALFESKNRVWLGLAFIDLCPVAFRQASNKRLALLKAGVGASFRMPVDGGLHRN